MKTKSIKQIAFAYLYIYRYQRYMYLPIVNKCSHQFPRSHRNEIIRYTRYTEFKVILTFLSLMSAQLPQKQYYFQPQRNRNEITQSQKSCSIFHMRRSSCITSHPKFQSFKQNIPSSSS